MLVDIDLPVRTPIAADRKRRYEELQERYGIARSRRSCWRCPMAGPTHGRPTARRTRPPNRTGIISSRSTSGAAASGPNWRVPGSGKGASEPRRWPRALGWSIPGSSCGSTPTWWPRSAKDDPSDTTGYLAFLDGRRALDDFQAGMDLHKAAIDPAAVDSLIARCKLRGESLQEALVLRAAGEILAGQDRKALRTLAAVVDAQATRTRFDRGDFILLDADSIATVRRRIADGEADRGDGVALDYALHRILEFDLPNPTKWSCGEAFRPGIRVRESLGDRYGRALIRSTEKLQGEARARALAKGLDGTFFAARGSIREIILERIPGLVGKEEARKLLPGDFYPRWID